MPRRNLIPFALLAVLALATLGFAVLGASSAPRAATLTVQNASTETFGSPTGSTSFAMELVGTTLSAGAGTGTITHVRLVAYVPPRHMAVYQVGARSTRLLAVLDQAAITCAPSAYTSIVGGTTPWSANGSGYTRTETLAAYSARVPRTAGTSCEPYPTSVHGQVLEKAVVRSGYLVGVRLTVVVPPQKLSNGPRLPTGQKARRSCSSGSTARPPAAWARDRKVRQESAWPDSNRSRNIAAMRSRWNAASPKLT